MYIKPYPIECKFDVSVSFYEFFWYFITCVMYYSRCSFPCFLPFSDPKICPRMFSICRMSTLVMGEFGNILFSTYLI